MDKFLQSPYANESVIFDLFAIYKLDILACRLQDFRLYFKLN